MKRLTAVGLAAMLVVGLATMAGAHKPEGELYFAAQFPDHYLPVMDGDQSEWAVVPAAYVIPMEKIFSPNKDINDVGRGENDPSEFSVRHILGFNANNDKLYFATEMFDDYHDVGREDAGSLWRDDDWEVRVNVSAVPAEEQNVEGEPINKIIYVHCVPPLEGIYERILPGEAYPWMLNGTEQMAFGWSYDGEMIGGESTYYYEMAIRPIVSMLAEGGTLDNTEFMDMEEGEIIHFNITTADTDAPEPATYNGFWAISPGPANNPEVDLVMAEMDDDMLANIEAAGTAVENISWGMIKAGIK